MNAVKKVRGWLLSVIGFVVIIFLIRRGMDVLLVMTRMDRVIKLVLGGWYYLYVPLTVLALISLCVVAGDKRVARKKWLTATIITGIVVVSFFCSSFIFRIGGDAAAGNHNIPVNERPSASWDYIFNGIEE